MGLGPYRIRPWPRSARRAWEPWREMDELRQAVKQVAARSESSVSIAETGSFAPSVDLYDSGVVLVVRIDLPGVRPADLTVAVENRVLMVGGCRTPGERSQDAYLCCERPSGRFVRTLALPTTVDPAAARATLADGVLEVILPKGEERVCERVIVHVDLVGRRPEPLVNAVAL